MISLCVAELILEVIYLEIMLIYYAVVILLKPYSNSKSHWYLSYSLFFEDPK